MTINTTRRPVDALVTPGAQNCTPPVASVRGHCHIGNTLANASGGLQTAVDDGVTFIRP